MDDLFALNCGSSRILIGKKDHEMARILTREKLAAAVNENLQALTALLEERLDAMRRSRTRPAAGAHRPRPPAIILTAAPFCRRKAKHQG